MKLKTTTLALIFMAGSAQSATIGHDAAGAFRGVTPDVYVGGKIGKIAAPIPSVDVPAAKIGPEIFIFILIVFALIAANESGSDPSPVIKPDPVKPNPVDPSQPTPVPGPVSFILMLSGIAALWGMRRV